MCIRDRIYGLLPLGTMGRLSWLRLTYPKLLTGFGTFHCSLSSLPLGFFFFFAYSCLVFSPIALYLHSLMERPLPPFLLIVVFRKVPFYLQLYSYFSSTISSAVLPTLFTLMPMTQPSTLLLTSNLLPLLLLELPLVFSFPILSLSIWMGFPGGVTATL